MLTAREILRGRFYETTVDNYLIGSRWGWFKAPSVRDRILEAVSAACDGAFVMIGSSCLRVHQDGAASQKGSRWRHGTFRGGLPMKTHALVDAEGGPICLALTLEHRTVKRTHSRQL
jgi:hypothetical protein